ncbi:uncharacterized protein LOC135488547 [Lineus longissimus]|uniref:uncharacterized protein LOC135488547 n=1 Tax=Lineus longissimus TaxID=88925 RepID=UPI00315D991A
MTLITQVEAVLNDRPLTYVGDFDPLTPAHLVHGRLMTTLPYSRVDETELIDPDFVINENAMRKRVKHLAFLFQHFWERWRTEYLPALRERHLENCGGKLENTVKVGDVVLVHSDEKRRLYWDLAIVEELNYGKDNLVRFVIIKTKNGRTSRPIAKLYPLEIMCNTPPKKQENDNAKPESEQSDNTRTLLPRRAATEARQKLLQAEVLILDVKH